MFLYFLKVTICWFVFYLVYSRFLSKETFFKTNRWYLLGTLLLGAGIPLLELLPIFQEDNPVMVYFQPLSEGSYYVQSAVNEVVTSSFLDWDKLFFGIYLIGVVICSSRFFIGLGKIYALYRKSEIIQKGNHTLVLTSEPHLPFSFFKYMFWSKDLEMNDVDGQKIVTHEVAHVKGWHSLDVILLEIFSIIFWVSPMVYYYKKSLKTVHEYLADAVVLQTTPTKKYGHLLLRQSQSGLQIALANHFFHSQLKQRIVMMTRSKSRKEAVVKYLFALPVILLLLIAFSKKEAIANFQSEKPFVEVDGENSDYYETVRPENFDKEKVKSEYENLAKKYQDTDFDLKENEDKFLREYVLLQSSLGFKNPINTKDVNEIGGEILDQYNLPIVTSYEHLIEILKRRHLENDVDEMPRFPGCEEITEIEKRDKCAQNKLLTFIYSNIKYPAEARKAGIQGKVIIKYVVQKDGTVAKARIEREIGGGCGEAALKVINALPKMIPGTKDGKAVDVEMVIPVQFKLDGGSEKTLKSTEEKAEEKELKNSPRDITVVGFAPKFKKLDGEIYKVVEEMPRFKDEDCEKMNDQNEQKTCAESEMLKFLYNNINYPKEAKDADIFGRVIAKFVVQKDGSIANPEVLRDIGGGCGDEVLRIIKMMPKWIPGKQEGKAVNVSYVLPIVFRLSFGGKMTKKSKADVPIKIEDKNIKITSDMKPLFIVDGKEFDKSAAGELKPDDIATINVLKGEKATEKYGDKGKDGVVEITLKKENLVEAEVKNYPIKKKTSLKDAGLSYVKISPNPSDGIVNIEYGSQEKPMTISIFDMKGIIHYQKEVQGGRSSLQNIDVSKTGARVLFIKFQQNGKAYVEKIILQ
jgi:TonB family protein